MHRTIVIGLVVLATSCAEKKEPPAESAAKVADDLVQIGRDLERSSMEIGRLQEQKARADQELLDLEAKKYELEGEIEILELMQPTPATPPMQRDH